MCLVFLWTAGVRKLPFNYRLSAEAAKKGVCVCVLVSVFARVCVFVIATFLEKD